MTKEDHKKLGIKYFNRTWDLIDKVNKSSEEKLETIQSAHQSLHHWRLAGGTPLNLARGEWLISHAYATLGLGEPALNHALAYKSIIEEHDIKDFDLIFVFEAMAFAYNILGMELEKNEVLEKGYALLDQIEKKGDRDYSKSQLDLQK